MSFLTLFYRYIVRDLLRKPVRTLLTLAGVALGIGVVVAVHLSNERAIGSFTDSLRIMGGQADYQIDANGLPLPESLMSDLSWFWRHGDMTALVEGRAGLPDKGSARVYGIDLLGEAPFRQYLARDGGRISEDVTAEEFIDLLANPRKLILPAVLADRLGVGKGSPLRLLIGEREVEFAVGAVLADGGTAQAFGGNVIFMDIAAAQLAFQKIGRLDRIDLRLHPDADRDAVLERVRQSLPASAVMVAPEDLALRSDKMLAAFRYNLTALSYLSLIVGVILVYNTLNISVVRRQTEIAALRTLGTRRRTVLWMFLTEAIVLGFAGAALGLWVGAALATGADVLISRTVETLYTGSAVRPFRSGGGVRFGLAMLALGSGLGAFSGVFPAFRATARSPVSVLRQGFLAGGKTKKYARHALAGTALLAVSAPLAAAPPLGGFPAFGYLAAVLMIAGFALLAPLLARAMLAAFGGARRRLLPVEAVLALESVRGGLGRLIVAVICLMIATAMLVSVATMVGSFRDTVVAWINQTLVADLYVKAAGGGGGDWDSPLSPATIETLRTVPGVVAVGRFRGRTIDYRGGWVTLAGGDFGVLAEHGNLLFLDGRRPSEALPPLIGAERVVVSEPFSLKYGVARGDSIELPTKQGLRRFPVEGVYYDYSSDRGIIVMDLSTYARLYDDSSATSLSVFLRPGSDAGQVRREIAARLPDSRLAVFANADLKREALRVFDQTFQVTYALELIAILVAALGVTNTLAALLVERQGEIALLRFLGASRRQIRRIALVESSLVGLLGIALGTLLGLLLSLVLVFVINRQSFGWTIQFELPGLFLASALAFVFAATIAAGFYPAWIAAKTDPIRSLRAE